MRLLEPIDLGPRTARNRVVFGPHETNLARGRAISERHVTYYRRRAIGGAGVIVVEEASVHPSDWPYERSPLAAECEAGWAAVAEACHAEGALAIAAIGHAGGQGSSAYSQLPLWAPSRVPEVNTREVPKWMEASDIAEVVRGFGDAARRARECGMDGVEVNAGQHSLVRQFLSGLTNQRDDEWGTDKLRFAREVLEAVAGDRTTTVGLRLSCDELAPWAGVVPDAAVNIAVELAPLFDYLTVVRGAIFSVSATRPDSHEPPGFNLGLAAALRAALPERVVVIAQGSIVDHQQAEQALADGICDAVEMTRAQIADSDLAGKLTLGRRARPCILCNQACQVRDARNPIVSCVVEPASGFEDREPPVDGRAPLPGSVLVIGGGVAGLECARVAALQGHRVTLAERAPHVGGMARVAARGAGRGRLDLAWQWLEEECRAAGVEIECGREISGAEIEAAPGAVVLCTGSLPGRRTYAVDAGAVVLTAAEVLDGAPLPSGPVVVWDPIGGPIGISVAELLTDRATTLATGDLIAGNELSRTGDLAPANVRLQGAGIAIARRAILRRVSAAAVELEDRFTGEVRSLECVALVDAGHRLPDDRLWRATGELLPRAGDAVAPRTIQHAILEGRRCALQLASARQPVRT